MEARADWVPPRKKIPRYGNLSSRFYDCLEALPKVALPDTPPRGQFTFSLAISNEVGLTCDLRGSFTVCAEFKSRKFSFEGEQDIAESFRMAYQLAMQWKADPPKSPQELRREREALDRARLGLASDSVGPLPGPPPPPPVPRPSLARGVRRAVLDYDMTEVEVESFMFVDHESESDEVGSRKRRCESAGSFQGSGVA